MFGIFDLSARHHFKFKLAYIYYSKASSETTVHFLYITWIKTELDKLWICKKLYEPFFQCGPLPLPAATIALNFSGIWFLLSPYLYQLPSTIATILFLNSICQPGFLNQQIRLIGNYIEHSTGHRWILFHEMVPIPQQ